MEREASPFWEVVRVFGVTFVGCLGFFWLLIEIYSNNDLQWMPRLDVNSLRVIVLIFGSVIFGLSVVLFKLFTRVPLEDSAHSEPIFEQTLVDALVTALGDKHYAEVIRIGVALIRPLFEEGKFSTRLAIGKVVEEAAALSVRKDVQVVALIDAIGWSLVELGQYDDAKRHIEHGIALSEEIEDIFYLAKGQRHLGVIARRTGDYAKAKLHYQASLEKAQEVLDDHEREVLVAGLYYAFASLHYHIGEYAQAMEANNKAIICFDNLNDEYRLNMSYVMKGDIQFRMNQTDRARDTFRTVLQRADKNTEKLQVVRARLGLAEIHMTENNWEEARHNIQSLIQIDLEEFKTEAERLKAIQLKLPKVN